MKVGRRLEPLRALPAIFRRGEAIAGRRGAPVTGLLVLLLALEVGGLVIGAVCALLSWPLPLTSGSCMAAPSGCWGGA